MVKRSRTLERVEAEAGVSYERTRLARSAARARPRLAVLLLVGAALMLVEAALQRGAGWVLGALALALIAWGVRQGRLGATVAAALAGTLAVLLPLRLVFVSSLGAADEVALGAADLVAVGASVLLGLAVLPDVVTLLRDAELQHAFGLWARRDDEDA